MVSLAAWELAAAPAGVHTDPAHIDSLHWVPVRVPGTAAAAVGPDRDFDQEDWWFRTSFDAAPVADGETVRLCLDGIASVSEVHLNGELILRSDSMFAAHEVDVTGRLQPHNDLAIRCVALAPLLAERRKPRARWRTRLVAGNLRFFRTMLIGRAPGFAPGPAAVGPYRAVRVERRRGPALEDVRVRPRVDGADGVVSVRARVIGQLEAVEIRVDGPSGSHRAVLERHGDAVQGELRVPEAELWWPHTHGTPALHTVSLHVSGSAGERTLDRRAVGFRSLAAGPHPHHDPEKEGIDLHVNGVRVFARGTVWSPLDPVTLAPDRDALKLALLQVAEAGMNMVRVPGIATYESDEFHDLCDELGILVWQDFMFANMDYPLADDGFRGIVETEADQVLRRLAGRPSVAVLCGGSEVEQQAAMVGVDSRAARQPLFVETLPGLARAHELDAVYVPSAPCGGDLPFRTDRGVANYYGVGAYRRPLEDARRADVRFAAECLAFANVPDAQVVDAVAAGMPAHAAVHDPRWKAGVPRDVGSGWDFEDVRDHYLRLLFHIDPVELRSVDHERYLELSRAVTGEVMAEVFGEWRRAGSRCGGGLVLWLRDLVPGAGWGVVDSTGTPKVAYHHLRRALAPQAVWMTDEGLNGFAVHVANDCAVPLTARLRVALYRNGEQLVDDASEGLELGAHDSHITGVEKMIGRFCDVSWAYRFGPPPHDVVVASLEATAGDGVVLSQAFRFPAGRPVRRETAAALGVELDATAVADGSVEVWIRTRRLLYGARMEAAGYRCRDDAFSLEPGHGRRIVLQPVEAGTSFSGAALTAINMEGRARLSSPATA